MMNKPKVIVFCCSGRFQAYLVNRLNQEFDLLGIVYCDTSSTTSFISKLKHYFSYCNPVTLFEYCQSRFFLPKYERKTESLLSKHYPNFYQKSDFPKNIDSLRVTNINDTAVQSFIDSKNADVICVNGTNLIREPLLSKGLGYKYGIINLHTGLSPYARGGNCNLFMLLERQPQYVGATVHYLDKGIDSGDIIRTVRPVISQQDTYEYIEAKVFIDGIDAMIGSVKKIVVGDKTRVKQWQKGKLFLQRTGYQYRPYQRLLLNRMIAKGLLVQYLSNKQVLDEQVRLVE